MKLRHMIVILFIFLAVVPLIFLGVTNVLYYNKKLETVLENDLRIAVSTQVKAIDNFFEERETDAAVIMGYQIVHDLMNPKAHHDAAALADLRADVNNLLQSRIGHNRFVESVTLLDPNFVVMACSVPAALGQVSTLRTIDSSYLSREMRFTHVVQRTDDSRQKVVAAVQEIYCGDTMSGYLVQELNLSFFEDVRVSASLFNNGTIYLLDGKGQMIAAGDTVESRENFVLSKDEQNDFMRAWQSRDPNSPQGLLYYEARGERYMSCYSDFVHTDWKIISSINMDQVLRIREGYRDLAALIICVLAVLLIAVNLIISRNIVKPIVRMISKFNVIRESQDYSIRMDENGRNELAVISREVNFLLSDIEAYILLEKYKQAQLVEKAQRDPLTGLYNKEILRQYLRDTLQQGRKIAFLFLDVDDFKNYNTRYGHMGGDRVLCFVADTLNTFANGMAGRQGGDEFVAVLTDIMDKTALEASIYGLLDTLNRGVALEGEASIPIQCSIGVALSESGMDADTLINLADQAMYEVKHHGKNNFQVFSHS